MDEKHIDKQCPNCQADEQYSDFSCQHPCGTRYCNGCTEQWYVTGDTNTCITGHSPICGKDWEKIPQENDTPGAGICVLGGDIAVCGTGPQVTITADEGANSITITSDTQIVGLDVFEEKDNVSDAGSLTEEEKGNYEEKRETNNYFPTRHSNVLMGERLRNVRDVGKTSEIADKLQRSRTGVSDGKVKNIIPKYVPPEKTIPYNQQEEEKKGVRGCPVSTGCPKSNRGSQYATLNDYGDPVKEHPAEAHIAPIHSAVRCTPFAIKTIVKNTVKDYLKDSIKEAVKTAIRDILDEFIQDIVDSAITEVKDDLKDTINNYKRK